MKESTVMVVKLEAKPNPDHAVHEKAGRVRNARRINIPVTEREVSNLVEASTLCTEYIQKHHLDEGSWAGGQVYRKGLLYAHVLFNGEVVLEASTP